MRGFRAFLLFFNQLYLAIAAGTLAALMERPDITHPGMTHPGKQRTVLLAVREGHVDPRLLTSALALCRRLEADLEIQVIAASATTPPEMNDFLDALREAGQAFSLDVKPSLRRRDLVDYANAHEHIAAVVIDSREGWEALALDRSSDPWKRLACPLVTASAQDKKHA